MRSLESTVRARTRDGFAPLVRELEADAAKRFSRPGMSRTECPHETATAQGAEAWSVPPGEISAMSAGSPIVFLLGEEPGLVVALGRTLRANGFSVREWTFATQFLNAHNAQTPGCLVTDLGGAGVSGLKVQRAMLARGIDRPVIFLTDEGDIGTAVLGMRAGAVTVLAKPVQPAELIEAVREAIADDATMRARRFEQAVISARLAQLSARERQVFHLISTGMLNKQIAFELGASEKTIKVHRGRILRKMRVRTATALVALLSRTEPPEADARAALWRCPSETSYDNSNPLWPPTVAEAAVCQVIARANRSRKTFVQLERPPERSYLPGVIG